MGVRKQQVLAALAACAFIGAAYYCRSAWTQYRAVRIETAQCEKERVVLNARRQQIEEQGRAWLRVRRFVDRAKELGLERARWDRYEVVIDEPVSFRGAREILDQAVGRAAYVFQPRSLEIVRGSSKVPPGAEGAKGGSLSADSPRQEGDLTVSLRGAFLVRQR